MIAQALAKFEIWITQTVVGLKPYTFELESGSLSTEPLAPTNQLQSTARLPGVSIVSSCSQRAKPSKCNAFLINFLLKSSYLPAPWGLHCLAC